MLQKDSTADSILHHVVYEVPKAFYQYMYLYTKRLFEVVQMSYINIISTALWAKGQSPPIERKPPQIKVIV